MLGKLVQYLIFTTFISLGILTHALSAAEVKGDAPSSCKSWMHRLMNNPLAGLIEAAKGVGIFQKSETLALWSKNRRLRGAAKKIEQLSDLPLVEDVRQYIREHPVQRELANTLKKLKRAPSFAIQVGGVIGGSRSHKMGEYNQAVFLKKVIEAMFPESVVNLVDKLPDSLQTKPQQIVVSIYDLAECYVGNGPSEILMDMKLLKPANAIGLSMDPREIRRILGIPTRYKVLGVYDRWLEINQRELHFEGWNFDVVFYSTNVAVGEQTLGGNSPILFLSDLTGADLSSRIDQARRDEKVLIIVNDTVGLLPYLHAAGDATFVTGAVNILESLQAGSPTVFIYEPHQFQMNYYDAVYKGLAERALATGHASRVVNFADAPAALSAIHLTGKVPLPRRPFFQRDQSGKLAIDLVLDRLHQIVSKQLESKP